MRIPCQYRLYVVSIFTLALASCAPRPSVYLPTSAQVPLLSKQGELRLSLAGNAANNKSSETDLYSSLEAAYAITEDKGIIGSFAYNDPRSDSVGVSFLYGELGGGYFRKFDKYGHYEFYGGVGYGRTKSNLKEHDYPTAFYSSNASSFTHKETNFVRPFLQGSLGVEGNLAGIALGTAVSIRASYLSVSHLRTDSTSWLDSAGNVQNNSRADTSFVLQHSGLFLEPCLSFFAGYNSVQVSMKLWWSYPVGREPPFLWANASVSVGLTVDLQPKD